jgi:hypothetical protein
MYFSEISNHELSSKRIAFRSHITAFIFRMILRTFQSAMEIKSLYLAKILRILSMKLNFGLLLTAKSQLYGGLHFMNLVTMFKAIRLFRELESPLE